MSLVIFYKKASTYIDEFTTGGELRVLARPR